MRLVWKGLNGEPASISTYLVMYETAVASASDPLAQRDKDTGWVVKRSLLGLPVSWWAGRGHCEVGDGQTFNTRDEAMAFAEVTYGLQ